MKKLSSPQIGTRYLLLGPAFKTSDLWLARDRASQKLVLLQRFANPNPAMRRMLALEHGCLPRVLDSWVSDGWTYLVLERLEGPDVDQLGPGILGSGMMARLRNLLSLLARLGWRVPSSSSICLDAKGWLRLRWFPRTFCEKSFQAA